MLGDRYQAMPTSWQPNMKLLDPKAVKEEKDRKTEELSARIDALKKGEADLIFSINALRETEESEKERIYKEIKEAEQQASVKKATLKTEMAVLEKMREEALKPIEPIIEEVRKKEEYNEARSLELEEYAGKLTAQKLELSEREHDLFESAEQLADREQECSDKEKRLDARERHIEASEKENERLNKETARKLVDYLKIVAEADRDIKRRSDEVESQRRANEEYKKSLDQEAARQAQDRKAIKDGYASLQEARNRILGRTT